MAAGLTLGIGVVFGQRTQLWWDLPLTESFAVLKELYGVGDADFKSRMAALDETRCSISGARSSSRLF